MTLTFRQVRHFIATAETGRVSAAAAALNVTQSTVTASIKALEAELGRKLFDRHSNGVSLTSDGQQFLQRARAIEASVSDAMRGPHRRLFPTAAIVALLAILPGDHGQAS
jgi:DNA-binding transcriptional LysR family regulator